MPSLLPAQLSVPTPAGPVTVEVDVAHLAAHVADLEISESEVTDMLSAALADGALGARCAQASLAHPVGLSRLVATRAGDPVFWGFREGRAIPTRFVVGEPRPTAEVTAWVERTGPSTATLATLYAGAPAPREEHDPGLLEADRPASVAFWSAHALVADAPGRTWLANAFSLSMLGRVDLARLSLRRVPLAQARSLAEGAESCVGHAQTAALFADELARPVACARSTVSLAPGDRLLVGQYSGPRLAEGATSLPEGSEIAWWWVEVGR